MPVHMGVIFGNNAELGGEYKVEPAMTIVHTNAPAVSPRQQRQGFKLMNEGHSAGIEPQIAVEFGPHYGVVAISQRDKVLPLADGLDHSRLDFDDDPLRGV